jgi:hypothetical protein
MIDAGARTSGRLTRRVKLSAINIEHRKEGEGVITQKEINGAAYAKYS